jgi:hypothetical protein
MKVVPRALVLVGSKDQRAFDQNPTDVTIRAPVTM